MPESNTFYVGLCMAGAVSAGAYTAGVMDYLIEALEEWEKNRNEPGVPQHRVVIPILGGASAGGMTGIITASAINNPIVAVEEADSKNLLIERTNNKFYNAWVDLIDKEMFPHMLKTNDISKGKIPSLFNSSFIDEIAKKIIRVNKEQWISRPYFDENLKVFTTLSNLRGLSFNLFFRSGNSTLNPYYITRHNDCACFKLNTQVYSNDGWIPLDFKENFSVETAQVAAMATGAFPVGLQARSLVREARHINDNPWLKETTKLNPLPNGLFATLNVDGGMINNEPFDRVRDVLISLTGQKTSEEYNNYEQLKSTILMIDPFPSEAPTYSHDHFLMNVIARTLGALINQARIKPETLADAVNSSCAGQFIIAPTRKVPTLDGTSTEYETGAKAIACGAFSGFSGFFHKEFRIHDYFLGRANGEKFLRDHFTVPASSTNAVTAGYASLSEEQRARYYSITDTKPSLPIIPVLKPRKLKYIPVFSSGTDWPVIEDSIIEQYRHQVKQRVEALLMNLADYNTFTKAALFAGSRIILRKKIAGVVMDTIKKSLKEHQLLKK